MTRLTHRRTQFVNNYLSNGYNAYKAAIDAGFSESFARDKAPSLIYHPSIADHLSKAYTAVEVKEFKTLCITISDKAKYLMTIINDVLPLDGSEPKRDYYKDAIKAIQELNKMSGDYAPDRRLTLTVDATKGKLLEAKRIYKDY